MRGVGFRERNDLSALSGSVLSVALSSVRDTLCEHGRFNDPGAPGVGVHDLEEVSAQSFELHRFFHEAYGRTRALGIERHKLSGTETIRQSEIAPQFSGLGNRSLTKVSALSTNGESA